MVEKPKERAQFWNWSLCARHTISSLNLGFCLQDHALLALKKRATNTYLAPDSPLPTTAPYQIWAGWEALGVWWREQRGEKEIRAQTRPCLFSGWRCQTTPNTSLQSRPADLTPTGSDVTSNSPRRERLPSPAPLTHPQFRRIENVQQFLRRRMPQNRDGGGRTAKCSFNSVSLLTSSVMWQSKGQKRKIINSTSLMSSKKCIFNKCKKYSTPHLFTSNVGATLKLGLRPGNSSKPACISLWTEKGQLQLLEPQVLHSSTFK